jgi:hypothetical protein
LLWVSSTGKYEINKDKVASKIDTVHKFSGEGGGGKKIFV